jgi:hypothetical protein
MSIDRVWLQQILKEDEFNLLDLPVKTKPIDAHDRLVAGFREICAFIERHGRAPQEDPTNVAETMLFYRLRTMTNDPEQRAALAEYDSVGILVEPEAPQTLEEVFASDDTGLLDDEVAQDIFALRNVPDQKILPDEIAERRPCKDFDQFDPLFKQCHADLKNGSRQIIEFRNETQISESTFYVLNGVLVYVAEVGEKRLQRGKLVARLRCIYENGTESNLLLRSLARALYKHGKRVTDPNEVTLERLGLESETRTATIYVLRSLSTDAQLSGIPHVHKIGYTTATTEQRTRDAVRQTTYLNAPVEIVAEYEVPAAVASTIEADLHKFFASACLDAVFERDGETVAEAHEWFSVPLAVIDEVIELMNAETIVNYEYDVGERKLRLRTDDF